MTGPKLNRQPGPLNEDALQMLRDKQLNKFSKVVTSDNEVSTVAVFQRRIVDICRNSRCLYFNGTDNLGISLLCGGTHNKL